MRLGSTWDGKRIMQTRATNQASSLIKMRHLPAHRPALGQTHLGEAHNQQMTYLRATPGTNRDRQYVSIFQHVRRNVCLLLSAGGDEKHIGAATFLSNELIPC